MKEKHDFKSFGDVKAFVTQEPLQTIIERADAENVVFAINYDPHTKRIHVEFHGSEEISLVEVDMNDLQHLAAMFTRSVELIKEA